MTGEEKTLLKSETERVEIKLSETKQFMELYRDSPRVRMLAEERYRVLLDTLDMLRARAAQRLDLKQLVHYGDPEECLPPASSSAKEAELQKALARIAERRKRLGRTDEEKSAQFVITESFEAALLDLSAAQLQYQLASLRFEFSSLGHLKALSDRAKKARSVSSPDRDTARSPEREAAIQGTQD